jgi:YHS domain-containing protein
MDDLTTLERLIRERLAATETRRQESQQNLARAMAEHELRTEQFETVSPHLMKSVIRPYMLKLASLFPNAHILPDVGSTGHHCACRFDHTAEYPASTRLDFGLSADGTITNVIVTYTLEILPVFFQFDGHDQMMVPLNAVDDRAVATWVNTKLLAFVDTYLRLGLVEQYQQENIVVDPVCGMSVNRASAGATCEHEGQVYYFCVEECCRKFRQDPAFYLGREK